MQPTPTPRRGRRGPVLAVLALLLALPVVAIAPGIGGSNGGSSSRSASPTPASFDINELKPGDRGYMRSGHRGRGRDCPFKHKQQREQSTDDGV